MRAPDLFAPDEDGNIVLLDGPPKPATAADVEQRRIVSRARFLANALVQRVRDAGRVQPTSAPRYACEVHEWPSADGRVGPLPHPSMCPACLKGADRSERKPEASELLASVQPEEVPHPNYPEAHDPRLEARWAMHLAKAEGRGHVLPGSDAEAQAVARLDRKREEAIAAERPRRPSYVSWDGKRRMDAPRLRARWKRNSGRTHTFASSATETHDDVIEVSA